MPENSSKSYESVVPGFKEAMEKNKPTAFYFIFQNHDQQQMALKKLEDSSLYRYYPFAHMKRREDARQLIDPERSDVGITLEFSQFDAKMEESIKSFFEGYTTDGGEKISVTEIYSKTVPWKNETPVKDTQPDNLIPIDRKRAETLGQAEENPEDRSIDAAA